MTSRHASLTSATLLNPRVWRFSHFLQDRLASKSPSVQALKSNHFLKRIGRYTLGLAIISLITLFDVRAADANPATAGFTLLIAILSASVFWGFGVSVAMSLAATLALDYFFLPPVGSLNIADPQDWIALASFLIASLVGSHLSGSARSQAQEANRRRQEVERLYDFSQRLLRTGNPTELCGAIPACLAESFDARATALFLICTQEIYRAGTGDPQPEEEKLRAVAAGKDVQIGTKSSLCVVPLHSGKEVIGSLGISGAAVSREVADALGSLVAVAIDRAGAVERSAKMEATRESEHLRSVVLDAITHDFRTPLTCIKASVTGLLADLEFEREEKKELLEIIDEECDRIDHLVDKASEVARVETGQIKLLQRPHSVGELISSALAECKSILRDRPIHCEVKNKEVQILVDLPLARTILGHLVSNADRYSSPGCAITIRAVEKDRFLFLSVADQGRGIDQREAAHIFEKFYRGRDHRFQVEGTGMGLPIAKAIVEAHGGTIGVVSQPGQGSVFTFSLPLA